MSNSTSTPNTYLNVNNAAKQSGWDKSTLSKAIKDGRLPIKEKIGNQYLIDPSDLERIFPKKSERTTNSTNNSNDRQQLSTLESTIKIRELELELKYAKEFLQQKEELLRLERNSHAETKTEKTRLLDTLDNQTRLLTHIKEHAEKPQEKSAEKRNGLMARFSRGKGLNRA